MTSFTSVMASARTLFTRASEARKVSRCAAIAAASPVRSACASCCAAPLRSLDAYRDSPHEWTDEQVDGLQAYARLIERLLLTAMRAQRHERTVKQLEYALEHRVVIERAVGVLMERNGLEAVAAFEELRSAARNSRRRAADVAAEILAGVGR